MKKYGVIIVAVALLAAVGLGSCDKEDLGIKDGGTIVVKNSLESDKITIPILEVETEVDKNTVHVSIYEGVDIKNPLYENEEILPTKSREFTFEKNGTYTVVYTVPFNLEHAINKPDPVILALGKKETVEIK